MRVFKFSKVYSYYIYSYYSGMKTLVFSSKVTLDGVPAGFSGQFKMLHTESGRLYVYRVHISKQSYSGSHLPGGGTKEQDVDWWKSMFYALTTFIEMYNSKHGDLPSDKNTYHDGRYYTPDDDMFGEKIRFRVEYRKQRDLNQKELLLQN
jgi:hypothetical protein